MKRTIILSVLLAVFILTLTACSRAEEIKGSPEEIYDAVLKNGIEAEYIYTVTGEIDSVEKDRVCMGNLILYPDREELSKMMPGDTLTFTGKAVGINEVKERSGELYTLTVYIEIKQTAS